MFKRTRLFIAPVTLACLGLLSLTVARADDDDDARCYDLASLKGNWALDTHYGNDGAHVAEALAVRQYDGEGNMKGTFIVNEPVVGSPIGERKVVHGNAVGTYTVECDGTGVLNRRITTPAGIVIQSEDFLITQAVVRHGHLIATVIRDMSRTPSPVVPGGLFVTRSYTRRPDPPRDDE